MNTNPVVQLSHWQWCHLTLLQVEMYVCSSVCSYPYALACAYLCRCITAKCRGHIHVWWWPCFDPSPAYWIIRIIWTWMEGLFLSCEILMLIVPVSSVSFWPQWSPQSGRGFLLHWLLDLQSGRQKGAHLEELPDSDACRIQKHQGPFEKKHFF